MKDDTPLWNIIMILLWIVNFVGGFIITFMHPTDGISPVGKVILVGLGGVIMCIALYYIYKRGGILLQHMRWVK